MNAIARLLLAVFLAALIVLPTVGSEGGENGGGTGIWILPRATFFSSGAGAEVGAIPRANQVFNNASQGMRLMMSDDVGSAVATLVDEVSGFPTALGIAGLQVTISSTLIQSMIAANNLRATIVVTDESQMGYYIKLVLLPETNRIELRVY